MRCAICDYFEGHSLPFAHIEYSTKNNKVRYRNTYKEYQCDSCFNAVYWSSPRVDPKFSESYEKLGTVTIETLEPDFDTSQEPPTVPNMPEQ